MFFPISLAPLTLLIGIMLITYLSQCSVFKSCRTRRAIAVLNVTRSRYANKKTLPYIQKTPIPLIIRCLHNIAYCRPNSDSLNPPTMTICGLGLYISPPTDVITQTNSSFGVGNGSTGVEGSTQGRRRPSRDPR